MEELLPSEIARLVLGFLKQKKCEKSYTTFLEECPDLYEYRLLYRQGKSYPTKVSGKSLVEILSEYTILKNPTINSSNGETSESGAFKENCKVLINEGMTYMLELMFQKFFPSYCSDNLHKDNSSKDAALSVHTIDHRVDNCIELVNDIEMSDEGHETLEEVEISTHKTQLERKLDTTNSTEQSSVINISKVNSENNDLQLVEPLMSDAIDMHIIKEENDTEESSVLISKSKKNVSDNTRSGDISSDSNKNSFNAVLEKQRKKLFKTGSHKVISEEYAEPIKIESESSDECDLNETEKSKNGFKNNTSVGYSQNNNSNVIMSQSNSHIASCSTQSTIGLTQGSIVSANNVNSLNNQSGYAIETTPFSSQLVGVSGMSFSSTPTYILQNYSTDNSFLQNNSPYNFVINTPNTWKGAASSFPLTISNIDPAFTSIESHKSNITPSTAPTTINRDPVGSWNPPSNETIRALHFKDGVDLDKAMDVAINNVCRTVKMIDAKNQKLEASKSQTSKSMKNSANKQASQNASRKAPKRKKKN